MKVCKIFRFDAAHYLPNYDGKCKSLHGHTWTLEVEVFGYVNVDSGMIVDFAVLKDSVNRLVIDKLDHTLLNDVVENPTCENLINWIWRQLTHMQLARLRLYETPDSYAERMEELELL